METNTGDGISDTAEAQYQRLVEPPLQGGRSYRRCAGCGVEAVTSIPWSDVQHRDDCAVVES